VDVTIDFLERDRIYKSIRGALRPIPVLIRLNRFFHLEKNRHRSNRFFAIYCDFLRFLAIFGDFLRFFAILFSEIKLHAGKD